MSAKSPDGSVARQRTVVDAAIVGGAVVVTALAAVALVRKPTLTLAGLAALILLLIVILNRHRLAHLRVTGLLMVMILLLPVTALLGPTLSLPSHPQLFAFRLLIALVGIVGLIWLLVERGVSWRVAGPRFAPLFVLWFAWLVITMLWAGDKTVGFRYLLDTGLMMSLTLATAFAGSTRQRLTTLVWLLAVTFVGITLLAIAESRLGFHLPTSRLVNADANQQYAVSAVFYNQNDLAVFLSLCWPFLLVPLFLTRRWLWRGASLIGIVLALYVVLHTGSRTSLITIALVSVACVLYFARLGDRRLSRRGKLIAAVAVLAFIGGASVVLFNTSSNPMWMKFQLRTLIAQVGTGQGSGAIRTGLQSRGLQLAGEYYMLGAGPGQAEVLLAQGVNADVVVNLHDWWLEVLVDGGLPALLLQVAIYAGLMIALFTVARTTADPLLRYLSVAAFLAMVGFIFGALGPSTASSFEPMWILFGLGMAITSRAALAAREHLEPAAEVSANTAKSPLEEQPRAESAT